MPPRKNSNIESITQEYIDGAVKVHVKASEVPPRQNLNISFKDADMLGDEVTLSNQEAYEESHGKIYEMTHNNTVPWRNWAFYLILLSMLTVCFTFAKYASFASGDAQTAVASFNVSVIGSAASTATIGVDPTSITDPGDGTGNISVTFAADSPEAATATITFNVTNNSDVTVKVLNPNWSSPNNYHSVSFSGCGNNIAAHGQGTFTMTITKCDKDNFPAGQSTVSETGTLTIQIDQVD